jgi:enolase-phosphatase E1
VTIDLRALGIRTILLDIEGTTTPVSFVYDVLFPYARRRLRAYLREHAVDAEEAIAELRTESGDRALDIEQLAAFIESLMDRDVKSPGLKQLQGLIWQAGYASGELHGQVFEDVPRALERWARDGLKIASYSSGSVLAQKLLFSTVPRDDLLPAIDACFDTGVGPKTSPESYRRIADALKTVAGRLLFVSDSAAELEAARAAGCHAVRSVRPGNRETAADGNEPVIATFDEIC